MTGGIWGKWNITLHVGKQAIKISTIDYQQFMEHRNWHGPDGAAEIGIFFQYCRAPWLSLDISLLSTKTCQVSHMQMEKVGFLTSVSLPQSGIQGAARGVNVQGLKPGRRCCIRVVWSSWLQDRIRGITIIACARLKILIRYNGSNSSLRTRMKFFSWW